MTTWEQAFWFLFGSEEWPEEWPEEWGDMQDARAPMRAKLAAAAPAMARALCLAEFSGYDPVRGCDVCPVCKSFGYDGSTSPPAPHDPDCGLHRSLTAAGLSPEDREEVRKGAR